MTDSFNTLKPNQLYALTTIPKTKYYVSPSELKKLEKFKKTIYQFWFQEDEDLYIFREYPYKNTKVARDLDMEICISKSTFPTMKFVNKTRLRQRAEQNYMIRKIYEKEAGESGKLGTGPLDLIRQMLGK